MILTFDGGSLGNPGLAYGSFRLNTGSRTVAAARRQSFGHGTNNQAEYRALIAGLRAALTWARRADLDPQLVRLEVRGDSQLVVHQVAGEWKVKDPELRKLHAEARSLLARFGPATLVHQPRKETVRVLGH
jgi:ribonuclease HI